ncbi:hypothetical protein D3C76_1326330 [compost metagenome]
MEQVLVLTFINAGITRLYSSEWIPLMIPLLEGMSSYWIVHLPSLERFLHDLHRRMDISGRLMYKQSERRFVKSWSQS